MPLLKVVVSSTRNSTETVAALERDLDGQSSSFSTHNDDQELVDNNQQPDELSQVCFPSIISLPNTRELVSTWQKALK